MKLTAQIKLVPTPEQANALRETLERANAACNAISDYAWENKLFNQFGLHKALYLDVRQRFNLSAQMAVRCLGKVADSYKTGKKTKRTFKPHGSIPYDSRILSYRKTDQSVSIWVIGGRLEMSYQCGARQAELLMHQRGESDLYYGQGSFFLLATCEIEEPTEAEVDTFLGVDRGIVNIAVDSDGTRYSGSHINHVRYRHRSLRRKLQKKGTKSAKRLLRKLAKKEQRFANDTNHCISKSIAVKAQGTGRGIVLEDLRGIRDRITARKSQRAALHSWSFDDLDFKITYKAILRGVRVVWVDPRNTSRTCPACGCIDKHNRPSQSRFKCVACGLSGLADYIAAVNIGRRASVNKPYVSTVQSTSYSVGDKLPDLSGSS